MARGGGGGAKKKAKTLSSYADATAEATSIDLSEQEEEDADGNDNTNNVEQAQETVGVKCVFSPILFSNGISSSNAMVSAPSPPAFSNGSATMAEAPRKRKWEQITTTAPIGPQPHAVLTEKHAKLWLHKFAASASLQPHHFPRHVYRLLGSITRPIDHSLMVTKKGIPKTPHQYMPPRKKTVHSSSRPPSSTAVDDDEEEADLPPKKKIAGIRKMTKQQAKREARTEVEDGLLDASHLEHRTDVIWQSWLSLASDAARHSKHYAIPDGWDVVDGSLVNVPNDDKHYVSIPALLRWMEKEAVIDRHEDEHCSLYHGLKHIPVDTKSILEALLDLSSPEGLYRIPLIMPYAVVTSETKHPKPLHPRTNAATSQLYTTWKISIAVYAHRLLPEVMSGGPLHTIMCALDPGSYQCIQPIHLPPVAKETVFDSCPYPVVVMDGTLDQDVVDVNEDDDDDDDDEADDMKVEASNNNKKKKKNKKGPRSGADRKKATKARVSDAPEPTREDERISAFTTKGLLKLLESRGCDTSNWPDLQTKILPHLKLQLMLHQEHAICWMVQMESLGGFGINSVLWETREFLDGGKYYYSPALGQIRLRPPPVMKGGLLCDEMGLGKTIEVLGLVLATLDDLKQEVATQPIVDKSLPAWHATLIVVPPALVSQWLDEIHKTTGDSLVVEFFDFKTQSFQQKSKKWTAPNVSPDIVVTTYAALEKAPSAKMLSSIAWGRVVLDEMQEIRQSTSKIARICEQLECNRRWMLSGTPLFEGIDDLRGELNFLRLEPFSAALEDGFFNFAIANHWEQRNVAAFETLRVLGLFILRRSKNMTIRATGVPILGLKPLTVEFVPIPQSLSERALYCFLEYVLAQELRDASNARTSRGLCLRLLRELCISTTLLNGGMGVSSQLKSLNDLLVDQARRLFAPIAAGEDEEGKPNLKNFSCEEAIRYLSVVQEATRSGEDEVSFMRLGFGQGMARRVRAELTTIEEQLQLANDNLTKATAENVKLKRKRAIALWHKALELVTTGHGPIPEPSKFSGVWRWRSVLARMNHLFSESFVTLALPPLLTRGWRPSQHFAEQELFQKHPEFVWAHPCCLELKSIPIEVETSEVLKAITNAIADSEKDRLSIDDPTPNQWFELERRPLPFKSTWNAYLQFKRPSDVVRLHQISSRVKGIVLPSVKPVPRVEAAKDAAKEKFDNASAAYAIHPCATKQAYVRTAKKELECAKWGLRIVDEGRQGILHVAIASALTSRRTLQPAKSHNLFTTIEKERRECSDVIHKNNRTIESCSQKIDTLKLKATRGVSREVEAMSAFEVLDALANGQAEKTQCPICLGQLGESNETGHQADSNQPGLVAMTKCGHLYCSSCLRDYVKQTPHASGRPPCPSCRKQVHPEEVMWVDPSKTGERDILLERRREAKEIVKAAADLLETSNGQLTPHMWEQLFLSVDQPEGVDDSLDSHFPSIPREVAAHFRAATRMPMNCNKTFGCFLSGSRKRELLYASRVQALLKDIPKAERCVVFSSSKVCIMHLQVVLQNEGIGCRVLFSGQSVQDSESAVSDWKSSAAGKKGETFLFPVLLVQSGAAASGLTLTAACKIFLMEPFVRYEEEQQAYARCHRYGQEKPVHVKCYYAPVSVESRLLEWRKVAEISLRARPMALSGNSSSAADPNIVYSSIQNDEESDQDFVGANGDNDEVGDTDQTEFLLGLTRMER